WQAAVGEGAAAAATRFSAVTIPVTIDVGALSGDRSFEFIFEADASVGGSSALMGSYTTSGGAQGLKFEQWDNTGVFGVTAFGVMDYVSSVPSRSNTLVHAVFTSNGA